MAEGAKRGQRRVAFSPSAFRAACRAQTTTPETASAGGCQVAGAEAATDLGPLLAEVEVGVGRDRFAGSGFYGGAQAARAGCARSQPSLQAPQRQRTGRRRWRMRAAKQREVFGV